MKDIASVVSKLRVKSGLVGQRKSLDGDWEVGFWYDRDHKAFSATLAFRYKQQTMGLLDSDVETRGKSQWMTDNTFRLTPSGVNRVVEQVVRAIQLTTERG